MLAQLTESYIRRKTWEARLLALTIVNALGGVLAGAGGARTASLDEMIASLKD